MSVDYNFLEMWKDFYNQSSNFFDETIKESFPAQGIAQVMNMNLQFKKLMDETTERYLQLVNVPSRKDIANLGTQIVNVDAKVDSLEELLEEQQGSKEYEGAIQQELTELKEEIKSLDLKLNQILTLLKPIDESK